jgi:hypothetical protein
MNKTNDTKYYYYSVHGLIIKSEIRLDDLIPAQPGKDIVISLKKLDKNYLETELKDAVVFDPPSCLVRVTKNAICYEWNDLGTALIRNGNEVFIDPLPGVASEEFSIFITGSILAILLNQRGILVLHAGAVVINGKAIAFLGDKGAGKSTLSACLQSRGHEFITDDLVPITFDGGLVQISPGFPRIKLRADSVKSIGLDWESLPEVHKFIDKRSYQDFDNFSTEPVNLSRIYILAENPAIEIKKLESAKAFIEITKHTYLARCLQATGQVAEHFQQCKALISAVPVYSLARPHNYNVLPEIASQIEKYAY